MDVKSAATSQGLMQSEMLSELTMKRLVTLLKTLFTQPWTGLLHKLAGMPPSKKSSETTKFKPMPLPLAGQTRILQKGQFERSRENGVV